MKILFFFSILYFVFCFLFVLCAFLYISNLISKGYRIPQVFLSLSLSLSLALLAILLFVVGVMLFAFVVAIKRTMQMTLSLAPSFPVSLSLKQIYRRATKMAIAWWLCLPVFQLAQLPFLPYLCLLASSLQLSRVLPVYLSLLT